MMRRGALKSYQTARIRTKKNTALGFSAVF